MNRLYGLTLVMYEAIQKAPHEMNVAIGLTEGPRVVAVGGGDAAEFQQNARRSLASTMPALWADVFTTYDKALEQYPDAVHQWEQWYFRGLKRGDEMEVGG